MNYLKLSNNVKIPVIGFGTYFINIDDVEEAVYNALKVGYRHLDCAKWYNNEELVGSAIKRSGIKREELFITTKVECADYSTTINNIYDSMNKMNTNYFDLVLIHWPEDNYLDTYRALEYLYKQGIIKAIGVSNFNSQLMDILLDNCEIKPVINQIETHIYFQQKKMNDYLKEHNICHESWSCFAEGYLDLFIDKVIKKISKKYKKIPAQIMLKFFVQKDIIVIPKSNNIEHMKENIDIFDFDLDDDSMKLIENLDKRKQYSGWPVCMNEETYY